MRAIRVLSCLLLPLALSSADRLVQHQYEGTLGSNRIGLTVLRRGNTIEGGHYFYQKFLRDIPLEGRVEGLHLKLTEKGEGAFDLHFVGNGSESGHPLDFENSIGMDGTWTSAGGAHSYPVSLRGATVKDADGSPRYGDVTRESDAAFEEKVQSFYRAVLNGDKKTAARYISYPLRVNLTERKEKKLHNSTEVMEQWDTIFTPAFVDKLRQDLPHDMFVHDGMAMLGNGEAWFDSKGLAVVNFP
jgi:hypothetical protein